jgi:riboflavin synthase
LQGKRRDVSTYRVMKMFTGIIEGVGEVKSVEKRGLSGRITIETPFPVGVDVGGSIAVDGVCLTVTDLKGMGLSVQEGCTLFTADMSGQTLKDTTLGGCSAGSRVNIERALTLSTPMGGHLVTGHIDAVGSVKRMVPGGEFVDIEFAVPDELSAYLAKKGSVAVDGISLTVAELTPGGFRVAVIPHTLKLTGLDAKGAGARVNIETDIIAKYVERLLAGRKPGVTEELLSEHGFLK